MTGLVLIGTLVLGLSMYALVTFGIVLIWEFSVVPLGLPSITFWQCIGLTAIAAYFLSPVVVAIQSKKE